MVSNRVGIIATAQTELRSAWESAQHVDLISSVVTSVFKGTGLTLDDVDFIIDSGSDVLDGRSISNCGFLGALGAHHKEEARVEEDGLWAALYGVNKIRSGSATIGLIVAYSKPSELEDIEMYWKSMVEPFYQRPVGFGRKAALGIQAQRYLAAKGITVEDLAALVAKRWSAAAEGGQIAIADVPSVANILSAPEAGAPLTDLMMSRPVDGAVAMLIGTEEIASRLGRQPVVITGMGTAMDTHAFSARDANRLASVSKAAAMATGKAGWSATDADVLEVSGSSVVGELLVLEALGFTQGLDAAWADNVNRSGGAIPADPLMATGLIRLADAYKQLSRPQAGSKAPSRAVVHGTGGMVMQTNCIFTLEV